MHRKYRAAMFDCSDEACGDPTVANVANKRVDGGLPFPLMYLLGDAFVRNNARVVLRHRDEDENAATIAGVRHSTDEELLKRCPVRSGALYRPRDECKPQRRLREQDAG